MSSSARSSASSFFDSFASLARKCSAGADRPPNALPTKSAHAERRASTRASAGVYSQTLPTWRADTSPFWTIRLSSVLVVETAQPRFFSRASDTSRAVPRPAAQSASSTSHSVSWMLDFLRSAIVASGGCRQHDGYRGHTTVVATPR